MAVKINKVKIKVKDISFQAHNEYKKIESINDVMYMYYDLELTLKNKYEANKKVICRAYDFPKIQNFHLYVDDIVNFDMEQDGYNLQHIENDGYVRDDYYHHVLLDDSFGFRQEYFIKIEKYLVKGHQRDGETFYREHYNLLFGSPVYESAMESVFIEDVTEEKLLELKQYFIDEIQKAIDNDVPCEGTPCDDCEYKKCNDWCEYYSMFGKKKN